MEQLFIKCEYRHRLFLASIYLKLFYLEALTFLIHTLPVNHLFQPTGSFVICEHRRSGSQ